MEKENGRCHLVDAILTKICLKRLLIEKEEFDNSPLMCTQFFGGIHFALLKKKRTLDIQCFTRIGKTISK